MKFEKLHQMKKGKHAITAACLGLGMVMLSSAVYASYDDANGYQNYKEAVKKLAFSTDNFTASVQAKFTVDGERILEQKEEFAIDGDSSYHKSFSSTYDEPEPWENENLNVVKDGMRYNIDLADKTYTKWEYDGYGTGNGLMPLGFSADDPTGKKVIRFAELVADAFIGDIKNNVVLESKENGLKNYTVSASEIQIPEVINAGVAVAFSAMGTANGGLPDVRYEDYDATYKSYYLQKTGNELPDEYYEREDYEKYEDVIDEFEEKIWKLQEKNEGGIIIVYKNAEIKYYPTLEEAISENKGKIDFGGVDNFMQRYVGGDAWIESGTNDFSIDEDGNLVSSNGRCVIKCEDKDGKEHDFVIEVKAKFKDYGTTNIEIPNLSEFKDVTSNDEPTVERESGTEFEGEMNKEVKSESKSEEKADAKSEDKSAGKSDAKTEDKSEVKSEDKSVDKEKEENKHKSEEKQAGGAENKSEENKK